MAHILTYSDKMAHSRDESEPVRKNSVYKQNEETHLATGDRRESLTEKAKEVLHDVAEKTMDLAHEVKEKIAGHVTDKDIAHAAHKLAELKKKLSSEQQQLRDNQLAAEAAENGLNLTEYEELKKKEQKIKAQEHETEREIVEAEYDYERLQIAQGTQKHGKLSPQ